NINTNRMDLIQGSPAAYATKEQAAAAQTRATKGPRTRRDEVAAKQTQYFVAHGSNSAGYQ
ncbi:hypothetical protein ACWESM_20320, partial [Nocardia sp. NPDC003999]